MAIDMHSSAAAFWGIVERFARDGLCPDCGMPGEYVVTDGSATLCALHFALMLEARITILNSLSGWLGDEMWAAVMGDDGSQ